MVSGSDLGVEETDDEEVDDPLVTRAPSKGKGKQVADAEDDTETDTAGMADDDVAFQPSSLGNRPHRVRPSSWPSGPVITPSAHNVTIGGSGPVISLNNESADDESTSPLASTSSATSYPPPPTVVDPALIELTPPTPASQSTPLPLPQTLLLNPYAGSLLTTHHPKTSKRRSLPAGSSPRTLTPTPSARTRTPLHLPKTLVLDLDETLIHSTSRAPNNSYGQGLFSAGGLGFGSGSGGAGFGIWGGRKMGPGHMVEVVLGGRSTLYHVYKRPFVDYFLKKVSTWYTLVIFTASMQEYADPVIDWLDAGRGILAKRFFRESCTQLPNGSYAKDLTIVESDLSRVALLDNSPVSYSSCQGWTNDPHDEALLDLLPFLDSLRFTSDVRRVLGIRGFQ
ncbi:Nuclear envelope morphology protein 1 [Tulasnella sp. 427]|nr:Nuclear envelope morphology protein 1 [Tulasnella sp. 427]